MITQRHMEDISKKNGFDETSENLIEFQLLPTNTPRFFELREPSKDNIDIGTFYLQAEVISYPDIIPGRPSPYTLEVEYLYPEEIKNLENRRLRRSMNYQESIGEEERPLIIKRDKGLILVGKFVRTIEGFTLKINADIFVQEITPRKK